MNRQHIKTIVIILALTSLAAAYAAGLSRRGQDEESLLTAALPQATTLTRLSTSPLMFAETRADGSRGRLVAVETTCGYGGPTTVATLSDPEGTITEIRVLHHRETPAYFKRLQKEGFFEQFKDRSVGEPLSLDRDVDAITGATVSSRAFTRAVSTGAHNLSTGVLDLPCETTPVAWNFGRDELILIVLFALTLFGAYGKHQKLRAATLTAGCIFLGFMLNTAISLSNLSAVALGFFPDIREKLFWYLLVVGTLIFTLAAGRNLYCTWLCPFGALQEAAARISGIRLKLPRRLTTLARNGALLLTWLALMIIFSTSNPTLGSYEPFAAVFGHEGSGVIWFIMPLALLGAFVIPRFWCRYFCPVGVILRLSAKVRRTTTRHLKRKTPCKENSCKNCSARR